MIYAKTILKHLEQEQKLLKEKIQIQDAKLEKYPPMKSPEQMNEVNRILESRDFFEAQLALVDASLISYNEAVRRDGERIASKMNPNKAKVRVVSVGFYWNQEKFQDAQEILEKVCDAFLKQSIHEVDLECEKSLDNQLFGILTHAAAQDLAHDWAGWESLQFEVFYDQSDKPPKPCSEFSIWAKDAIDQTDFVFLALGNCSKEYAQKVKTDSWAADNEITDMWITEKKTDGEVVEVPLHPVEKEL